MKLCGNSAAKSTLMTHPGSRGRSHSRASNSI